MSSGSVGEGPLRGGGVPGDRFSGAVSGTPATNRTALEPSQTEDGGRVIRRLPIDSRKAI